MRLRPLLALCAAAGLAAADPAAAALAELQEANRLRAELAREEAAWTGERQRLEALIAATLAEAARVGREAEASERARDAGRQRLLALGAAADLAALRTRLDAAAGQAAAALQALAAIAPPGVVVLGADRSFEGVVRTLEVAERAAGQVAVEVVAGRRDGREQAVKLLRVSGAAAWWVSLDGAEAGIAQMRDGVPTLTAVAGAPAAAIRAALAQAEGRAPAGIEALP